MPPRSGSCPAARGSASPEGPRRCLPAGDGVAALVPFRAGAGLTGAAHPRRGWLDHPGGLRAGPRGAGLPPLRLSIPLPAYPEGFLAIYPAPSCVPMPCGAARWQLAEPRRACPRGGGTVGTPQRSVLAGSARPRGAEPLWLGWPGALQMSEPTRVPWPSASHPGRAAPWGHEGLPTTSLLPNPTLSLLEPPGRVLPLERGLGPGD